MIIKCWGVRGSIPVSGTEYLKYGGDTTCIEIISKNNEIIVIDAGSGIRQLGNKIFDEKIKKINLLLTHTHWDHILGFPFFKPLYFKDTKFNIYGCPFAQNSVKEMISAPMNAPYFPVSYDDIPSNIEYFDISTETFNIDSIEVTPIALNHPNQGLGYKFTEDDKTFIFLTDNELIYDQSIGFNFTDYLKFCSNADVLLHDAEYTKDDYKIKKGWGHSCYVDALQLAMKSNVKHFGLIHHNQDRFDIAIDEIVDDCENIIKKNNSDLNCFAVWQGMEINFTHEGIEFSKINLNFNEQINPEDGLQAEIEALNERIANMEIEKQKCIQLAIQEMNDESLQLKSTISALREELEKKQIEKDHAVQSSVACANSEIIQLKETISALRDELEVHNIKFEEKLQETNRLNWDETKQLKDTIATLREAMENISGK